MQLFLFCASKRHVRYSPSRVCVWCLRQVSSAAPRDIKTPTGDGAQTQNRRFFRHRRRSVMGSCSSGSRLQKRRRRAAAAYLFFSLFPAKVRAAAAVAVGLPAAGIIFACLSSVADAREGESGISFV